MNTSWFNYSLRRRYALTDRDCPGEIPATPFTGTNTACIGGNRL